LDSAKLDLLKQAALLKFKIREEMEGEKWIEYKKTANSLSYAYSKQAEKNKKKSTKQIYFIKCSRRR